MLPQAGRVRRPEECFARLALWIDGETRRYAALVGALPVTTRRH